MQYLLPAFTLISTRFVSSAGNIFELWSPNSSQNAFYPGRQEPKYRFGLKLSSEWRRCDGHLGRFDPTVSPQHYSPSHPWYPYIKRTANSNEPEWLVVFEVWERKSEDGGYICNDYLTALHKRLDQLMKERDLLTDLKRLEPVIWATMPVITHQDIEGLSLLLGFDEAVDNLVSIQRSLKHMDGWNRMASLILKDHKEHLRSISRVETADDSLIGVWLNGTKEEEGLQLLRHRVPCFILSEVISEQDLGRVRSSYVNRGWVALTAVAALDKASNIYDRILTTAGVDLRHREKDIGLAKTKELYTLEDKKRASSTAQGYSDGCYLDPRSMKIVQASRQAPSSLPTRTEFGLMPPPVQKVGQGTWSFWTESTLDDDETPCMERLGKNRKNDMGRHKYYDRVNLRVLGFDTAVRPHEGYLADANVFGLPAPDMPFVVKDNYRVIPNTKLTRSKWMYRSQFPAAQDIDRAFKPTESLSHHSGQQNISRQSSTKECQQPSSSKLFEDVHKRYRILEEGDSNSEGFADDAPPKVIFSAAAPLYKGKRKRSLSPIPSGEDCERAERRASVVDSIPMSMTPLVPEIQQELAPASQQDRQAAEVIVSPSVPTVFVVAASISTQGSHAAVPPTLLTETLPPPSQQDGQAAEVIVPPAIPTVSLVPASSSTQGSLAAEVTAPPTEPEVEQDLVPASVMHCNQAAEIVSPPAPSTTMDLINRIDWSDCQHSAILLAGPSPAINTAPSTVLSFWEHTRQITSTLPPQTSSEQQSLDALFPLPTSTCLQLSDIVAEGTRSTCLVIWNFPAHFLWCHVVAWIGDVSTDLDDPAGVPRRILRTNERGYSVYWLKFRDASGATLFRGAVAGRRLYADGQFVACDFIPDRYYAGANGRSQDYWQIGDGLSQGRQLDAPHSTTLCSFSFTVPDLLSRLHLPEIDSSLPAPPPFKRRRGKRKSARKSTLASEDPVGPGA